MGGRIRRAGFTLIELLLVLSISALLLAMTPALLHKAFPVLKLKAAARDLVQEMRYVQNAAIINGQRAQIRFDLERGEYSSELVNGGEVRALPGGLSLSRESAPGGSAVEPSDTRFLFYPDGSANGGALYLANERQRLRIQVDWLTGRIQLDEPSE
ncbi:MAG: GspH/FimT family pseudopilin [Candidatus Thiodiazotropha sp.]